MTNKELADILLPNIDSDISIYEKKYPKRDLPEGKEVTRFAPSPTGRIHLGNLFAAFTPEVFARQSDGVFILRIEDTDEKRAIENGTQLILDDLKAYDYKIDENPIDGGEYGPYIQTERANIYATFAKHLISIGRAYPCFCSEEELTTMRDHQEKKKTRVGYYGRYAKCRGLTLEEIKEKLASGEKFVIRLKSEGDFETKIKFEDLVKGTLELPKNDIDYVLIKSDGIPPYAFAHVVDDYLMRTTTVTRDDSYISTLTYHLEIWEAFGFDPPRYAHLLPLNIKDGESVRKISKRKDPEAAISFHHERGIPKEAIKLYFATVLNSNFEEWYLSNPDKNYKDFNFTFDKMSKSGSLFDMEKLINLSKNYISRLSAEEVYNDTLKWAQEFDVEFAKLLESNKDYAVSIFNIEREISKPRKDYSCYSDIKNQIWYMYDELFDDMKKEYEFQTISDKEEMSKIITAYIDKYYDDSDSKEEWFNKVKELADEFGYAKEVKEYKNNPENYKGHVGDISSVLRIVLTTKSMTPDLYEIMKILGKNRIKQRYNKFIEG